MMGRLLLIGALLAPVAAAADVAAALKSTCEGVATKYDVSCSMALYGRSGGTTLDATASAGFIDGGLGLGTKAVPASDDDVYVYGSITKMFTASAIYQLAERGALGLDDSLAYHVDAMLPGTATLATAVLVNDTARAGTITLRHALHMKSGISDYDGEKYAYEQFANRSRDFSPLDILLGGFVNGSLEFTPGEYQDYSSTNYILLGLVAARYDAPDVTDPYEAWKAFDQAAAAKGTLSKASKFVDAGPCDAFTPVKGFMERRRGPTIEVSDVLRRRVVRGQPRGPGPGHVGDTYGYQSQATYFPDYGFTLAVATNAEMEAQAQPGDATCVGFHAVLAALGLGPRLECAFVVPRGRRFMGTCECKNATALP
ncbi:beta-lactamase [Aureococcus anophagefferens]|nr:beta-lactamase [Aureococcus anophagefferens]